MANGRFPALRFAVLVGLGIALALVGGMLVDRLVDLVPHRAELIRHVGGWIVGMIVVVGAVIPLLLLFGVIRKRPRRSDTGHAHQRNAK